MHNQEKTTVTNTQIEKGMNKDLLINMEKNGLIMYKDFHLLSNLEIFIKNPAYYAGIDPYQKMNEKVQFTGILNQIPQSQTYVQPNIQTISQLFNQSSNNMTQQEQTPQPKEYAKDWNSIIEFLDTAFQKVSVFNYITGVERLEDGEEIDKLSKDLILEELAEHKEALDKKDRVEELDAICDLIYVGLRLAYKNTEHYIETEQNRQYQGIIIYKEINQIILAYGVIQDFNLFLPNFINLSPFSLETIKQAFDEVHRSNMSKFCTTEEDAIASVQAYEAKGVITDYKQIDDYYIIYRFVDDKTLKGIHYSPPSLQDLV